MSTAMFKFIANAEMLPLGFIYPKDYREFSSKADFPVIMPWSFLWEKELNSLIDGLRKRYPDRALVPFARRVDCDDIACFDGSDITGNPAVYIVHDYASPGWEQRGRYASFSDWLKGAVVDAQEWAADE